MLSLETATFRFQTTENWLGSNFQVASQSTSRPKKRGTAQVLQSSHPVTTPPSARSLGPTPPQRRRSPGAVQSILLSYLHPDLNVPHLPASGVNFSRGPFGGHHLGVETHVHQRLVRWSPDIKFTAISHICKDESWAMGYPGWAL